MAAGSSIFRLVHIPTRPLLSPVSEIYGAMPRVCGVGMRGQRVDLLQVWKRFLKLKKKIGELKNKETGKQLYRMHSKSTNRRTNATHTGEQRCRPDV